MEHLILHFSAPHLPPLNCRDLADHTVSHFRKVISLLDDIDHACFHCSPSPPLPPPSTPRSLPISLCLTASPSPTASVPPASPSPAARPSSKAPARSSSVPPPVHLLLNPSSSSYHSHPLPLSHPFQELHSLTTVIHLSSHLTFTVSAKFLTVPLASSKKPSTFVARCLADAAASVEDGVPIEKSKQCLCKSVNISLEI